MNESGPKRDNRVEAGVVMARLAKLLDQRWIAVLLSTIYPTVFALSNNWYAISGVKIAWLLMIAVAAGLAAWLAVEILISVVDWLLAFLDPRAHRLWSRYGGRSLVALLCSGSLFVLLNGTLREALGGPRLVGAAFLLVTAGLVFLFTGERQRYFTGVLGLLTLVSAASWLFSGGVHKLMAHGAGNFLTEKQAFETATLSAKPNVYFFIYDAYGSRDAYLKVFGFDNFAHYQALERRGFKVVHTFSNYFATWPTTLSVFLGTHHFYRLSTGVDDTKFGRSIMAGLARNPVLETFKANGYRLQQIHGIDYFLSERGVLDFVFPEEPVYSAMRIYDSPLLNKLVGRDRIFAEGRRVSEQKAVLFSHFPDPPGARSGPWFTFSHVNLPKHGPTDKTWLQLKGFEEGYVEATARANEHMLSVIDAIAAKDPEAIVVIIGDHGAWRYRKVWTLDADPNRAFEKAGIDPEIITYDIFGAMIAVRSRGRCDDRVYPGVTPVNVMRIVIACLAQDPKLLENRPEDISLFVLRGKLWLTAKDGQPLAKWQPYEKP